MEQEQNEYNRSYNKLIIPIFGALLGLAGFTTNVIFSDIRVTLNETRQAVNELQIWEKEHHQKYEAIVRRVEIMEKELYDNRRETLSRYKNKGKSVID